MYVIPALAVLLAAVLWMAGRRQAANGLAPDLAARG
jgi:hypothetical protein